MGHSFSFTKIPVFIPYLLGFMFALMAFDHALHAYAQHWGPFWFFRDYERLALFDYVYLFDQAIIMPMIFFCIGSFLMPHLQNQGMGRILRNMAVTYGIPFVIGSLFVVPLLVYPRYQEYEDPNINLLDFWQNLYFSEHLQAGPFWVMYALALYSLIALILHRLFPSLFSTISAQVTAAITRAPKSFFVLFISLCFIILFLSDLMWGAPWWVGFGKFFYLQGARFVHNFLFFCCGIIWSINPLLQTQLKSFAASRTLWHIAAFMLLTAAAYTGFCMINPEVAYPPHIRLYMYQGYDFSQAFSAAQTTWAPVAVRTVLLAILSTTQALFLLGLFSRLENKPSPRWQSLGRHGYGIFILHETFTVWMQYMLINWSASPAIKMMVVFLISFPLAWFLAIQLSKLKWVQPVLILKTGTDS